MIRRVVCRQKFTDGLQANQQLKARLCPEHRDALSCSTSASMSRSASNCSISNTLLTSDTERQEFLDRFKKSRPSTHPRMRQAALSDHRYAVCVPLLQVDGRPAMLFTLRANQMNEHRGQVSFPGGAVEPGESLVSAALREMHEEIGVEPNDVQVWTELHPALTRAMKHTVTPVIGVINPRVSAKMLKPHEAEVQEVFTVLLDDLCASANVRHTQFRSDPTPNSKGENRGTPGYSLPVFLGGKYRIWGLTAVVLHQTLSLLVPHAYKSPLKYAST